MSRNKVLVEAIAEVVVSLVMFSRRQEMKRRRFGFGCKVGNEGRGARQGRCSGGGCNDNTRRDAVRGPVR